MSTLLNTRLGKILETITSESFLQGKGRGNELAFHIFDYPPEKELAVREHIQYLEEQLRRRHPDLKVLSANLFRIIIEYLQERKLLTKSYEIQQEKGDAALGKALQGPLSAEKFTQFFIEHYQPATMDLVLLHGVGSAWPLLRTHSLLNNLAVPMATTPLVLFYPGRYDGVDLRLFGKSLLSDSPSSSSKTAYYRAFRLIPEESIHAD